MLVFTWAQDERPADLHMAQLNGPMSKTGAMLALYLSTFPPLKVLQRLQSIIPFNRLVQLHAELVGWPSSLYSNIAGWPFRAKL
jgi:hypothetical protein